MSTNLNKMTVNRRRFLRGLGACMALPAFESFLPRALGSVLPEGKLATTPGGAPVRMALGVIFASLV